ncbi:hypothetical protein [Pontibacter akesuensis]|uniref:Uncharacterized protein n=1 Tax=Pontibacter akesuensis TaxID=388950 RepID=A0A1I7KP02_9BACT|nr:hypothetical protein [Pontibacter akesuensis]GHA81830.1 hypothetical protein GCM10007389_40570 [Pontibacter akesuensis]SFU99151.1 hypothetical protein SAMN04487941_3924 [Pontibacter akesuensis]
MKAISITTNVTEVSQYTVSFRTFKKIGSTGRVKQRQIRICRDGACIYSNTSKEEERTQNEQWAKNFLVAMKRADSKRYMAALDLMWEV